MNKKECTRSICARRSKPLKSLLRHHGAVAVWVRKGGEWAIIHRCKRCGKLSSNRVAADDNPMKLMSIAMKPLCSPPFPLDYIEEMTALMGGDGRMR